MNVEPASHSGVAETAKFGAGQLILTGLGRFKPDQNVAARHRILLQPQIRQEKTMYDISGEEMNPHDLVHRHMQIVVELEVILSAKLAIRPRIDDFPVKLLCCYLKLKVAFGRGPFH